MIRKLRRKLIAACMISLTIVLAVILGGVNLMGYQKVVADADTVLALLGSNDGAFPKSHGGPGGLPDGGIPIDKGAERRDFLGPKELSPETPYESRFFSVVLNGDNEIVQTDTVQIAAVDDETAGAYAQTVAESGRTAGFLDDYRYLVLAEEENTRATLLASAMLSLLGLTAVLLLLLILSHRIVHPVAESYEKQKRFITDAGHEPKTPMTIISADADLLEMECGENQWLTDIRRQAQRLTGLTNDLIYLSRMEEEQPRLSFIEFPLSDVAEEMALPFQAPARSQGKEFTVQIQPMLSCTGDEKSIRQLLSILLDNALKYSPAGGELELRLEKLGRNILLTVTNTTEYPVDEEKLSHLFDRFYRSDQSRNSQTGGYGLGLSIARSIVLAHKGKIRAEKSPDGRSLSIVVALPA